MQQQPRPSIIPVPDPPGGFWRTVLVSILAMVVGGTAGVGLGTALFFLVVAR